MATFQSTQEFLQAIADLLVRLEARGQAEAAARLREGLRCVNGLTDGWALFLESVETVQADDTVVLAEDDQQALERIRTAVRGVVYRK
jgi:hypothetical protein